ncbi:hypothetical protein BY996DRAFT_6427193 [Phakopsora pachyrhizi]|nr:hypothetical protein BY996DRAFT_6427193 [Phakopsora pachyrhizi]
MRNIFLYSEDGYPVIDIGLIIEASWPASKETPREGFNRDNVEVGNVIHKPIAIKEAISVQILRKRWRGNIRVRSPILCLDSQLDPETTSRGALSLARFTIAASKSAAFNQA